VPAAERNGNRNQFSARAVLFIANSGRSTWYVGVLLLVVYATFAMTLYLLPPPR
jgi:Ca2+:H+ antiporter